MQRKQLKKQESQLTLSIALSVWMKRELSFNLAVSLVNFQELIILEFLFWSMIQYKWKKQ